jgi:hypothetical protein
VFGEPVRCDGSSTVENTICEEVIVPNWAYARKRFCLHLVPSGILAGLCIVPPLWPFVIFPLAYLLVYLAMYEKTIRTFPRKISWHQDGRLTFDAFPKDVTCVIHECHWFEGDCHQDELTRWVVPRSEAIVLVAPGGVRVCCGMNSVTRSRWKLALAGAGVRRIPDVCSRRERSLYFRAAVACGLIYLGIGPIVAALICVCVGKPLGVYDIVVNAIACALLGALLGASIGLSMRHATVSDEHIGCGALGGSLNLAFLALLGYGVSGAVVYGCVGVISFVALGWLRLCVARLGGLS